MSKELKDFFKIIAEGKKESKKVEKTENESFLSDEKLSVSVKANDLTNFFKSISEEKKRLDDLLSDILKPQPSRMNLR